MENKPQSLKNIKPIIFWNGFPVCGLLIKKVAEEFKDDLIVLGTKGPIPLDNAEELLGHKIIWLKDANDIWKRKEEFGDRNLIIHTGWAYSGWRKYGKYMKKQNDAKVVVAVDNRYRRNLRQFLGAIWFRLYLNKIFDAVIVPGKEGIKLMKFLGMNPARIYTGIYGAYEKIFHETNPVEIRNKEFLFVGRLIELKAIDILVQAFNEYQQEGGTWNMRIVGNGPLRDTCVGKNIFLEDFAQPEEIAQKMNQARVLILPSKNDNWGTVICEAAACGMQIISTKTSGATADIIQNEVNGIVLDEISTTELKKALFYFENLPTNSLKEGSKVSKEIANKYDSSAYYNSFTRIVKDLFK